MLFSALARATERGYANCTRSRFCILSEMNGLLKHKISPLFRGNVANKLFSVNKKASLKRVYFYPRERDVAVRLKIVIVWQH